MGSSPLNSNTPVVRKKNQGLFFFENSCNAKIHPYHFKSPQAAGIMNLPQCVRHKHVNALGQEVQE